MRRVVVLLCTLALSSGAWAQYRLQHTNPRDIPKPRENHKVHSLADFDELISTSVQADSAREAYKNASQRFGNFPLYFVGDAAKVMVVSFRDTAFGMGQGCWYPLIAVEFLVRDPKPGHKLHTRKFRTFGESFDWIYIYPRTGPVLIGAPEPPPTGEWLTAGDFPMEKMRAYCREANKPVGSYPRY